ncbi:MAG: YigZ family protein [Candidatus Enterosoma sp.]|nr:YigZ family protein [Bacilli bacterium]MDD7182022.1 YigZ family protein [Bacilli bacterium]MDY3046980.1 YigZ family protein [Candidatus Enterosoma sp.]
MKELKTLTYDEKHSQFIGILFQIDEEDDLKRIQEKLDKDYPKANHILRVLRYKNHFGVYVSEASEDKEPISSMKKTRNLMERKDIKDVGVYIVRYFGGTKLGASRLDHVYFTIATDLLSSYQNQQ